MFVLAVVSGIIKAAATGEALSAGAIALIIAKAFVFLFGALVVGSLLSPRLFRGALALRTRGVVLTLSLGLCFVLAYLALLAGLAPIVGAFAAGLVLEEVHFEGQAKRGEPPLHESLEPLIALLVPVFFVRMGMLVDLRSFASTSVLGFAALLTVAAVLGKLACALATPKGIPRLTVGLGMMPRGEVGLIFAGIGAQLVPWAASSAGRAPGSQSRGASQPINRSSNNLQRRAQEPEPSVGSDWFSSGLTSDALSVTRTLSTLISGAPVLALFPSDNPSR